MENAENIEDTILEDTVLEISVRIDLTIPAKERVVLTGIPIPIHALLAMTGAE